MALYLGNSGKLKVNLNQNIYRFNIITEMPTFEGIALLSSDGYFLQDVNRVYLTALDSDPNNTSAKLGKAIIGVMKLGG